MFDDDVRGRDGQQGGPAFFDTGEEELSDGWGDVGFELREAQLLDALESDGEMREFELDYCDLWAEVDADTEIWT